MCDRASGRLPPLISCVKRANTPFSCRPRTRGAGSRWRGWWLVVGEFPNWDAAYHEGQRMQGSGQLKEFTVVYLPFAAELDRFAEFDRADRAIVNLPLQRGEVMVVPALISADEGQVMLQRQIDGFLDFAFGVRDRLLG